MKKTTVLVLTGVLGVFLLVGTISFAAEATKNEPAKGPGAPKVVRSFRPGTPAGYSRPMMMSQMQGKSMVASSDGGVFVMMGQKILKYDKDLNLVKETEVKISSPSIPQNSNGSLPPPAKPQGQR